MNRWHDRLSQVVVFAVLCCSNSLPAMDQPSADALASGLLGQIGKNRGICEIPRAGDGRLALSFVQRSQMLVHAMNPDVASVNAVRSLLDPTGLVGTRAYVEKGTASVIPLTDNYADLVVITNLTDADLSSIPVTEIVRSLCPGGKAYVGRAASEGNGLSTTALQNWVNGRSDATVKTDALGTWGIITKAAPTALDEWSHSMHGPDNNPFCNDSIVKWPYLPQWRAKPYTGIDRHGALVAAGGRLYSAMNRKPVNWGNDLFLTAYRIYNGQVLWTRMLQKDANVNFPSPASLMVASPNCCYVMNGNKVDQFDGEQGTLTRSIIFDTQAQNKVKWIALSGRLLYGLVGTAILDSMGGNGWSNYYNGTVITAIDTGTQAIAWSHTEAGLIDSRKIGISKNRLYFVSSGQRVVALNASTGAQLWENRDGATMNAIEARNGDDTYWPVGNASGFLCSSNGIYNCQPEDTKLVALSSDDGHLMWLADRDGNRSQGKVLMSNGILLNRDLTDATRKAWNVLTNQTVAQYGAMRFGDGCGMIGGCPDGVFGNALGQSCSFSLGRNLPMQPFKTTCGTPMIPTNGLAINPNQTPCTCVRSRGMVVESPAGSFTFDRDAVQSERLEMGPAAADLVSQVTTDALDWSTHRAAINRCGYVATDLAAQHNLIWRFQRTNPYPAIWSGSSDTADQENTPPVTSGTRVFWGGSDGYVRCFDTQGKAQSWSYPTGGRVYATPTVAGGCVFVGSMDGYAYCLEAHTGRLVWRFRAAPIERRIALFGQLVSTWPVNSGVIVKDNVAYFAAGMAEGQGYGTHMYALNARTGAIVWQNNAAGGVYKPADRSGINAAGYMTIVGSRLWLQAMPDRPGIFDLATGAFNPFAGDLAGQHGIVQAARGREIGLLDNTHVISGARYQFADQGEQGYAFGDRSINPIDCYEIDANGQPRYPQIELLNAAVRAPSWDGTSFYTATWASANLEKWSIADMVSTVNATRAAHPLSSYGTDRLMREGENRGQNGIATSLAKWRVTTNMEVNAIALARNGVVVLNAHKVGDNDVQTNWQWYVSILSTSDGSVTWKTSLPMAPTHDGIAINRTGDIVVSLRNGDLCCYGAGPALSVATRTPEGSPPDIRSPQAARPQPVDPAQTNALHQAGAPSQERPGQSTSSDTDRLKAAAWKVLFPLKDSVVTMKDGSRTLLYTVPQEQRTTAVYQPRDMRWYPERQCLPVSAVTASSSVRADGPNNTVDRKLTTRWAPSTAGAQWIMYDLGRVREISSASLVWYSPTATRTPFSIEVSGDGRVFSPVDAGALGGRGTQTSLRTFLPASGRYVRLRFAVPGDAFAPSLYEFGVHGSIDEARAEARQDGELNDQAP